MSRRSIFRKAATHVVEKDHSDYVTPFASAFECEELCYLKDIIDKMADKYFEIHNDSMRVAVYALIERGKKFLCFNVPMALRFFIEAMIICIRERMDKKRAWTKINFILSNMRLEHNVYAAVKDFVETFRQTKGETTVHSETVKVFTKKYRNVVKTLNVDDSWETDDLDYELELSHESFKYGKEGFEDLFTYWLRTNRYKTCLLLTDEFISQSRNCEKVQVYGILPKIFLQEIMDTIPNETKQDGIVQLKIAHKIGEIEPTMAIEFAKRARFNFDRCKYQEGINWVIQFMETENISMYLVNALHPNGSIYEVNPLISLQRYQTKPIQVERFFRNFNDVFMCVKNGWV